MSARIDPIGEVLVAPETSGWLRESLRSAMQRDPLEAANDAEQLAELLTGQVEAMLFLAEWRAKDRLG